jgi:uncharacterized membrane protein
VSPARREETHSGPVLAVTVMVILALSFPPQTLLGPRWIPVVLGVSMLAVELIPAHGGGPPSLTRPLRPKSLALLVIFIALVVNFYFLFGLIDRIVAPNSHVNGTLLVRSAVVIWINNIVLFSLWFWHVDRGGPEGRAADPVGPAELLFPTHEDADWMPTYMDYLFVAFNTATAFSPTDVAPLSHRTKLLMMVQSATSLLIVAIVAARGVNIL